MQLQAVYFNYCGDLSRALEHYIACANWQKAHSLFMTSVAHSLFLSGKISYVLVNDISLHNLCYYLIFVPVVDSPVMLIIPGSPL